MRRRRSRENEGFLTPGSMTGRGVSILPAYRIGSASALWAKTNVRLEEMWIAWEKIDKTGLMNGPEPSSNASRVTNQQRNATSKLQDGNFRAVTPGVLRFLRVHYIFSVGRRC